MTKSQFTSLKSNLINNKSAFMSDELYKFDKSDLINLYKELSYAIDEYIKVNENFNEDRTNRECLNFVQNFFIKSLEDFSYCDIEDEDEDE